MAASASLPPFHAVSPSAQRLTSSPRPSSRSENTSPANHASPVFANGHPAPAQMMAPDSRAYPAATSSTSASASASAQGAYYEVESSAPESPTRRPTSTAAQPRQKLVLDYATTEPDPEELLCDLYSTFMSTVTQPTKGAEAYFRLLHGIARMTQGQAMAHALAAMIATQQAKLGQSTRKEADSGAAKQQDGGGEGSGSQKPLAGVSTAANGSASITDDDASAEMLELANRHHLASIKALQTQQQPNRRRRFSVIETNPNKGGDDLPVGSNAAAMMLLILACSMAGKSLMLPSYFNQCEQFLADAVEQVSSQRMFPSITGDPITGTAEDPPIQAPEGLNSYGTLLFIGTVVGLYECFLSQYTAVTDWDYNPARLRRLLPFNWSASDAAIFDSTRASVSETTYSVSMVTLELVIETLDTMRKFKRAEDVAYGKRKSSRSEAEDGVAALDSLALREELGLLIRDLEAGSFWKGPIRILSEDEQLLVLDNINGRSNAIDVVDASEEKPAVNGDSNARKPTPSISDDPTASTSTKAFSSGALFLSSASGDQKQVNRLRLANHLYRNALLVDLYVTVFNRPPSSLAVRELVSRSISFSALYPTNSNKASCGRPWF